MLTNIAHDIATFDGRSTLANLRGTCTFPLKSQYIATIRRIITLYSSAITHSVAHSRIGGFARLDPDSAMAIALNSPAEEDESVVPGSDDQLVLFLV